MTVPLIVGAYELKVIPVDVDFNIPLRFEMRADGSFIGHRAMAPESGCAGTATSEEVDAITAALNVDETYCAMDFAHCGLDRLRQSFDIVVTAGVDAERQHRFHYESCGVSQVTAVNDAIGSVLGRTYTEGGCVGEGYDYHE